MGSNKTTLDNFTNSDWQILGQLTLPAGMDVDVIEMISAWLPETLRPLQLQGEFLEKVVHSAQQALKTIDLAGKGAKFGHYHLLVFAQAHSTDLPNTWGFFRIEKIVDAIPDTIHSGHAIEIYLYPEGIKGVIPPGRNG